MFFVHSTTQRKDYLPVRCPLYLQHLPSLRAVACGGPSHILADAIWVPVVSYGRYCNWRVERLAKFAIGEYCTKSCLWGCWSGCAILVKLTRIGTEAPMFSENAIRGFLRLTLGSAGYFLSFEKREGLDMPLFVRRPTMALRVLLITSEPILNRAARTDEGDRKRTRGKRIVSNRLLRSINHRRRSNQCRYKASSR
jgi:hypothetical protein